MVMQEPRANVDLVMGLGCLTEQTVSSHSFQAQLDEIHGELSRFDNVKGDLEIAQEGVGSRLVGLALYLKNLFTREKSTSLNLNRPKFNRVPRKSCEVHAPLEVVLSKMSRQDGDEVLEEANERCKKRAVFSNDLTMEADSQPRR